MWLSDQQLPELLASAKGIKGRYRAVIHNGTRGAYHLIRMLSHRLETIEPDSGPAYSLASSPYLSTTSSLIIGIFIS